ncbi:MAG: hypothetical protein HOG49_21480 [Candidatus Scalindua sp.]|jgi:hypothetical protein|nr:hypothetical protein [Candidatus Scalindua sp.]
MADKIPLRLSDDQLNIDEFDNADTIAVTDGGTGAPDAATARVNLDVPSNQDLSNHTSATGNVHNTTPAQIGSPDLTAFNQLAQLVTDHFAAINPHNITTTLINAVSTALIGAANGIPQLDGNMKILVSQIPAIGIPSVKVVADATARIALVVQEGDEAIQLDDGSHWIMDENNVWQPRPNGSVSPVYSQSVTTTSVNVNQTPAIAINFNNSSPSTAGIFDLTASRRQVLQDGDYRIAYSVNAENNTNSRKNVRFRLRKNGTVFITGSVSSGYARNGSHKELSGSSSVIVSLAAGDYVELTAIRVGTTGNCFLTDANLNLEKIDNA